MESEEDRQAREEPVLSEKSDLKSNIGSGSWWETYVFVDGSAGHAYLSLCVVVESPKLVVEELPDMVP